MSVTMRLADNIDVSRGDMICRPHNKPVVGQDLEAMVCWMTDKPLQGRATSSCSSTPPAGCGAVVRDLHYRLDVNTLHRDEGATTLTLNDVGRVAPAGHPAALLRPVPSEPVDRVVHPGRRGLQRDGRGRHAAPPRLTERPTVSPRPPTSPGTRATCPGPTGRR